MLENSAFQVPRSRLEYESLMRASRNFVPYGTKFREARISENPRSNKGFYKAHWRLEVGRWIFSFPLPFQPFAFKNVPSRSSSYACWSCACVFITIGPYQATGSCNGLPETNRKRMPSSPAWTTTSSPLSNRINDRLSASVGGVVSSHLTPSVGTARGADALQNFPLPANT